MSLTLMYASRCGRLFQAYVPKQKAFGEILGEPGDWQEVDAQEERDGEIEAARYVAEALGAEFVDTRETELVVCRNCTEVWDPLADFKMRGRKVGH